MKSATSGSIAADGPARFRRLALALPGTVESSHCGSPDFRVHRRIFATLAFAGRGLGTLKVSPEQQALFLAEGAPYFEAAPGGWGRMGVTLVQLHAPDHVLSGALQTAYRLVASKAAPAAKARRRLPEA